AEDRGYAPNQSIVTVMGVVAISPPIYSAGDSAASHLDVIGDSFGETCRRWTFTLSQGRFPVLLVISPSVAAVVAESGWSKRQIREHLHREVVVPVEQLKRDAWQVGHTDFDLERYVEQGIAPAVYGRASGNACVPVFPFVDDIAI